MEVVLFTFSFRQPLAKNLNIHISSAVADRKAFVRPAWLCALVGFLCFVMLVPGLLIAQTEVSGDVSGVWTVDQSPYIVTGSITVLIEDTLTIEPGVEIRIEAIRGDDIQIDDLNSITVFGAIIAHGEEDNWIQFISNHEEPQAYDWRGFEIGGFEIEEDAVLIFEFVRISHTVRSITGIQSELEFENCHFSDSGFLPDDQGGIVTLSPNAIFNISGTTIISNCEFSDIPEWLIWLRNGSSLIQNCTFNSGKSVTILDGNAIIRNSSFVSGRFAISTEESGEIYGNHVGQVIVKCLTNEATTSVHHNIIENLNERDYYVEGSGCHIRGSGVFYNNTVIGHVTGLTWDHGDVEEPEVLVKNNIFAYNQISIAAVENSDYFIHDYNLRYSPAENTVWREHESPVPMSPHDLWCEPEFNDTTLWRVSSFSPTVDRGDPDDDFENEPMPNGERINLGCYGNTENAATSPEESLPPIISLYPGVYSFNYVNPNTSNHLDILVSNFGGQVDRLESVYTNSESIEIDFQEAIDIEPLVIDTIQITFQPTVLGSFQDTVFFEMSDSTLFCVIKAEVINETFLEGTLQGVLTKEESPYLIMSTTTVVDGDTLWIEPGVVLRFDKHSELLVNGCIIATGTIQDSISFLPLFINGEYLPWRGLRLSFCDYCDMNYCKIGYVNETWYWTRPVGGIYCEIFASEAPFEIKNSSIYNCEGYGLYFNAIRDDSRIIIRNCNFFDNIDGLRLSGVDCSDITVQNNTISSNEHSGLLYYFDRLTGNSDFSNNNICFNGEYGVRSAINAIAPEIVQFSNIFENQSGNFLQVNPGPRCISENPLFLSEELPFRFHLTENSPLINVGNPNLPDDPDGTQSDIGSIYFHVNNTPPQITRLFPARRDTTLNSLLPSNFVVDVENEMDQWVSYNWTINDSSFSGSKMLTTMLPEGENQIWLLVSDGYETSVIDWQITAQPVSVSENDQSLPDMFEISGVYPNPVNSHASVTIISERNTNIELNIYDINGRLISQRSTAPIRAGKSEIHLDFSKIPSGIYMITFSNQTIYRKQKLVIVR